MKRTINSYFKPARTLMILSLAVSAALGTVSCQKDIAGTSSGEGFVTISVNGIKENNMGMPVSFASESNSNPFESSKSIEINGINAEVFSSNQDDRLVNEDGTRSTRSTSPMKNGSKYQIVLFKGTEFYKQFPMESNVAMQIPVEVGVNYNWIAYSYNSDVENAPSYNINSPIVPTKVDKDLLFAKGTIQTDGEALDDKVEITFEHKVSMVRVEVNNAELHGDIKDLDAHVAEAPYYKTGTFNLVTGEMEYGAQIDTKSIPFTFVDPADLTVKESVFYTANNTGLNTVTLNINKLTITNPKGVDEELIGAGGEKSVDFTYKDEATTGVKYIGRVALWRVMGAMKIVHAGENQAYGYSGFERASRNLLDAPSNFGPLAKSKVKVKQFSHVQVRYTGQLLEQLNNPEKPDIVIMNVYYIMSDEEVVALADYVNKGGVLILGSDNAGLGPDAKQHLAVLNKVFNTSIITMDIIGVPGTVFPITNLYPKDVILSGPFGDLHGKNWGEDASLTRSLENVPSNQIVSYSDGKSLNDKPGNGITTFRHKKLNIFWIGDGGWIANELQSGTYPNLTIEPFATDANHYPVVKMEYGHIGNGHDAGSMPVSNSILFANVMNWACIQAEYSGINSK